MAEAYRDAVGELTALELTTHYTRGLDWFHQEFVPELKQRLNELAGGVWNLDDYRAIAAGSDVDLMAHIVNAVTVRQPVFLYPGDWYGFLTGCPFPENMHWSETADDQLACLCIPSVRNGHLTQEMLTFLQSGSACLLNLNLFPTLLPDERKQIATQLNSVLENSLLSISFSRGFGLTASQLGVVLVHRDHPFWREYERQWNWFTYFFNVIAAQAFLRIDSAQLAEVDVRRRGWVHAWLTQNGLPVVESGSYYVKSFQVDGSVPDRFAPLVRDTVVRLCFKPPQV